MRSPPAFPDRLRHILRAWGRGHPRNAVSRRTRPGLAPAAPALALLVAACQPLPHPFADDRPPAALLRMRDTLGVAIAPVIGTPPVAAAKLPGALARALLKHDIPASDKTASLNSYQLFGRVAEVTPRDGKRSLAGLWRLYDAKGRTVGERTVLIPLASAKPAGHAAIDAAIEQLAAASADRLAPLLEDDMPTVQPGAKQPAGPRIAIGAITGAPGDGATALTRALAAVLRRDGIVIVGKGGAADLDITGTVRLTPVPGGKQHVALVWRVSRPGGGEIGTVGQQNDVSRGTLDGPWGDIAYSIAIAAGDGLVQVIERGLPPAKS
jgi:hypothetical protein